MITLDDSDIADSDIADSEIDDSEIDDSKIDDSDIADSDIADSDTETQYYSDSQEEESYNSNDSNDSQDDDDVSQDDDEEEDEEEENIDQNTKLNDKWILWYHHEKNNWKISGYRKIYKIETIKDFWELYNNFDRIGGINNQHFFLMREGIEPIWEDKKNQSGGCWSFKKMENESAQLWEDLSVRIVGENLLENNEDINGLSICLKRQSNSVIKIWNNNSKKNQINLLNKDILNKYGKDILYIAHIPEF